MTPDPETSDLNRRQRAADRKALARCYECCDDSQDVDVGRAALDRLVAFGWLEQVGKDRWEITSEGFLEMSK